MANPETVQALDDLPQLLELAKTEPKIDTNDPRIIDQGANRITPVQYRDTFFMRIIEIRAVTEDTATTPQIAYLRMVKERFGLDLVSISLEHQNLFSQVYDAIDAKEPYDRLTVGRLALLSLEDTIPGTTGLADSLDDAANHPLGIEAIGIFYWDKINPLLEQAYGIISERSLNAPFLTR